ncbi:MAG: hypothetical protein GWN58_53355, partial [Anaerolineae bacterium]|nr:hypothetical protein [Anaerolineae bacterium]
MSRKGFLVLAVILCATVLVSLAEAGPQIEGLYRLQFDPLAGNSSQALRPGEAVNSAGAGELLLITGRGFSQGVVVLFNNLAVSPVAAPPFSNEQRLVVAVPEIGAQTVRVAVQTGEGRSNELTLTILGPEQEGDRESYATFRAIDEFLFLAEEAIRVSLEELPATFQWLATETVELLNRDRLLALQVEGGLSSLSHSESKLLDGLFVSVGLRPLLEGYIHSWQDGIADFATLEGLRRTMEYKGSALKALGEFLGQVTVTVWGGSEVTSAGQKDLGSYFRALGELNQNLAGNVAFLAKLLHDAAWQDRWLTLSQGIGDLTLGLGVLERKLDDPNYGLEALQGKIDRLDYSLKLTLNSSMSRLESWLREIVARLDNQVGPSLAEILARLDSPQYGLAEIKAEVMTIESQMVLT